jgi:hypothetical protein
MLNHEEAMIIEPAKELPVAPESITPRRCSNRVGYDGEKRTCGWNLFDQVVVLGDISSDAPTNSGETVILYGFACRSCGALLPDGLPPELYVKFNPDSDD